MQLIIKTDFKLEIRCEQIKIGEGKVYYKTNVNDSNWQDVHAHNVKYIQIVNNRDI